MPFNPDEAINKLDLVIQQKKSEQETKTTNIKPGKKPFFGLPPEMEKTLFPRAVETREKGGGPLRTAVPGALDVISLPLRAGASLPALAPGGETFTQALGRIGGKERQGIGKVAQVGGDIMRDPLTILAGAAAKPLKISVSGIGAGIKALGLRGAAEQAIPAVTRQIEESSRTGKVDIPGQSIAAVKEVGLGGIGSIAGGMVAGGSTTLGKKLMKSVAKTKDVTAKLAGKDVAKGLEEIASDIVNYNLESTTGGFKTMAKKATGKIEDKSKALDQAIKNYIEAQGDTGIDIDKIFKTFENDIKKGKELGVFGSEKTAVTNLKNIYKALKLRGMTGTQPVSKLREIKRTMREGLNLFKKGKFGIGDDPVKSQVGEIAELRIGEELNRLIPESKGLNEDMRRLYTTRRALIEADKRTSNHNFLSLRTAILTAAGIGGGSWETLMAGLGASMVLGVPAKGRGASAIIQIGRQPELLRQTGRIIGVSNN
jgi:hypothetical protein